MVQLVRHDDGRIEERTPPRQLPGGAITVLDVYGQLFYAGARTFERLLPTARGSARPAVRHEADETSGAQQFETASHKPIRTTSRKSTLSRSATQFLAARTLGLCVTCASAPVNS